MECFARRVNGTVSDTRSRPPANLHTFQPQRRASLFSSWPLVAGHRTNDRLSDIEGTALFRDYVLAFSLKLITSEGVYRRERIVCHKIGYIKYPYIKLGGVRQIADPWMLKHGASSQSAIKRFTSVADLPGEIAPRVSHGYLDSPSSPRISFFALKSPPSSLFLTRASSRVLEDLHRKCHDIEQKLLRVYGRCYSLVIYLY